MEKLALTKAITKKKPKTVDQIHLNIFQFQRSKYRAQKRERKERKRRRKSISNPFVLQII